MKLIAENIGDYALMYIKTYHGTQTAAAKAWGCSTTLVSQVVKGERSPTKTMLEAFGMERRVRYVQKDAPDSGGYPE